MPHSLFAAADPEDKEQPFYSIMSSDANMQKAIQRYKGFIEEAENIDAIFLQIGKSTRLNSSHRT